MVNSDNPQVTVVVVQRERFSTSQRSLESLLASIDAGVPIVYVDNASPPGLRDYLRSNAGVHGIRLIHSDSYLSPTQQRNSAMSLVETEYVVFVDNDVIFTPGWLEAMVRTAVQRNADVVTPLIQHDELEEETIHTAGGSVQIVDEGGKRKLKEVQRFYGRKISDVAPELKEEPTGMAEGHCLLVRAAFHEQIGLFDRHYLATSDHLDYALEVQRANGAMWFCPAARVTYLRPPPIADEDRLYFSLRWSKAWTEHSEHHLFSKWDVEPYDYVCNFTYKHRRHAFKPVLDKVRKVLGRRFANLVAKILDWRDTRKSIKLQSEQAGLLLEKSA